MLSVKDWIIILIVICASSAFIVIGAHQSNSNNTAAYKQKCINDGGVIFETLRQDFVCVKR